MVECYGVFCGHHNEAMSFYKEQLQNNKKMQLLMRVSRPHALTLAPGVLPVLPVNGTEARFLFTANGADESRRAWLEQRSPLKTKPLFHGRKSDSCLWCDGWEYPSASCW